MYKILLVEDEAGIRNAMLQNFDWASIGCVATGVESGLDALNSCLQSPPDIVITDIVMPGIDGMTLVRYLKKQFPTLCFIIITGHREFEYAKQSIEMGVQAFLLKPIDEQALRTSIVESIQTIESYYDSSDGASAEVLQEKQIANMLNGYIGNASANNVKVSSALRELGTFVVASLKIDDDQAVSVLNHHRLYHFCKTVYAQTNMMIVRMDEHITFLCPISLNLNWQDGLKNLFGLLQKEVEDVLHFTISIGISIEHSDFQTAKKGYLQSIRAVGYQFFFGISCIVFYQNIMASNQSKQNHPSIASELEHIKGVSNYEQHIDAYFQEIINAHSSDVMLCKSEIFCELLMCIYQLTAHAPAVRSMYIEKYNHFKCILCANSLEETKKLFMQIVFDVTENTKAKNKDEKSNCITTVLQYLQESSHLPLTLTDVARVVMLSPTYLSTLISNETGRTFVELLNGYRIQNAIQHMKSTQLKNYEIAEKVGFNEPQYFSVVFKKYTGFSPTEYRQLYCKEG